MCLSLHLLPLQEDNYGSVFLALDKLFLVVFIMEILFKWYHDFLGFWRVGWNVFDFVIVAASLLGPSGYNQSTLLIAWPFLAQDDVIYGV